MNHKFNLYYLHMDCPLDGMSIYKALALGKDCIFLDSSKKDSHYSKYSIIGANPYLSIQYKSGQVLEKRPGSTKQVEVHDFFDYLHDLLKENTLDNPTDLPMIAGALGYLSYDLCEEIEELPHSAKPLYDIPDGYFVCYDNYIILDHVKDQVTVSGLGILEDSKKSVTAILDKISCVGDAKSTSSTSPIANSTSPISQDAIPEDMISEGDKRIPMVSPFTKSSYMEAVEIMRNYIEDGHIYIANMTHTFSGQYSKDPTLTYENLRRINPAPFSAYMPLEGFQILSSSPERFVDIRQGLVKTRPIKGTVPRGSSPEEDLTLRKQLEASEKDKSELLMIVDLERNDLSKVCTPGSVKVTELFKTEQYATVYHLVSTIEGRLKENYSAVHCIKAAFPGGSITGAPKIRAMEIIDELEANKRHLYTGSIGYFGFDGNADFNIVIRTMVLKDDQVHIGVGGGITWESDPASEYQETLDKAKALFATLNLDS